MKKRKLILAVLALSLIAAMSLTGCTKPTPKDDGTSTPSTAETKTGDSSKKEDTPKVAEEVKYEKGTMTADGFESAFLNMKFTPPADFIMATEEETSAMLDFGTEIAYSDEAKTKIDYSKASVLCEMMASTATGVPNVNLMIEKLPLKNMKVDQYVKVVRDQLLANEALTYTISETTTPVTIAGQEYQRLDAQLDANGATLKQELYMQIIGDRVVAMSMTFSDDTVDSKNELLNAFTALK